MQLAARTNTSMRMRGIKGYTRKMTSTGVVVTQVDVFFFYCFATFFCA